MVKYGVDLIWWMTDDLTANQSNFWKTVLDDCSNAGVEGIEITGHPTDSYAVEQHFGSKEKFKEKLDEYNLKLCSAFMMMVPSFEWAKQFFGITSTEDITIGNLTDPSTHDKLVTGAEKYAKFLQSFGAEELVLPPPHRSDHEYIGFKVMNNVAEGLMKMGKKTLDYGVRTSIHTNGFSILNCNRDVDLLMTLTDPDYVWVCPDTAQLTVGEEIPSE